MQLKKGEMAAKKEQPKIRRVLEEGTTKKQPKSGRRIGRSISGWINSVKRMQVPLILRFPTDTQSAVRVLSPQSISPREHLPTLQGKD